MKKIAIIGAGAWGTALAQSLANAGRDVLLWARENNVVESINHHHENSLYLKGVRLNEMIKATHNMDDIGHCDIFLISTPAQHVRTTLESMKNILAGKPFVICAKGIEINTGLMMTEVAHQVIPDAKVGVLSGPTFASEIARGLPCAVTLGMKDKNLGEEIVGVIGSRTLRTYLTEDVIGAQIGGAVKNVIAIASGVVQGRKMGESARCALVTRGLTEMGRLATAMGAKKSTLMGMCGVGDLILTCSSMQSRNFSLGVALGEGKTLEEILGERIAVTEGVHTAKALQVMAKNHAVDMPISKAVNDFLNEGIAIEEIVEKLLDRPLRKENI
ncbi:MAG TPA: NAD(P)H-dependent glycerol-3-phosphate dehydrogenase [Alphaproteobacteria bacterium]|nr:NAD(P)H-dependent glycerol-3-phosphate dehydrogenase [Alphaproteobacteria bacterium]